MLAITSSGYPSIVVRRTLKQGRSEITVQKILVAANEVIAEKGVAKATMADIASTAHSSIGSIYSYFESKEALLQALREICLGEVEYRISRFIERVADSVAENLTTNLFSLMLSLTAEHKSFRYIFFSTELGFKSPGSDSKFVSLLCGHISSLCPHLLDSELKDVTETVLSFLRGILESEERLDSGGYLRVVDEAKRAMQAYLQSRLV